ncbi:F-box protein PP2-B15-like [Rutidosis leptorrhynchoides]|uniref:F-box protein PP2-B15-like n=1 Tax=Rutidosis leptorrhynchoides TaxID=125765 RepID=UPI003A9A45D9
MERLPEDCIAHILSCGSPQDACRFALVALMFKNAADSEILWNKFLPSDHQEIISKSLCPVTYKSKKELFYKLSSPLLIDGGLKTFSIDKRTGKISYMLSARELYIAWSGNPLFWCWKPLVQSRFAETVELRMTSWLEIQGTISTKILSSNTKYEAYLIFQVSHHRAYGLDVQPTEVSIEVGKLCSSRTVILGHYEHTKNSIKYSFCSNKVEEDLKHSTFGSECCERNDGWLEIKFGDFYNYENEKEVKMSLKEVNGVHLKGGLIVEGIEIRPAA